MPEWESIPIEFKNGRTPWNDLFNTLFFKGGSLAHLVEKPGINRKEAIQHIRGVMQSFDPKHEHKEAACAYLFSLWFEPIQETKTP